ncbi:hypothetical protein [Paracoccus sp. (in: a-proteobacteria)]|nr:hypothetical protein [Paracoccus sp. (in: a-proteobacteria)]
MMEATLSRRFRLTPGIALPLALGVILIAAGLMQPSFLSLRNF